MVTIGSMTLRDFEVPQVIRYGGQQRLAVHHTGDGRQSSRRWAMMTRKSSSAGR